MKRMDRWHGATTLEPPKTDSHSTIDLDRWLARVSLGPPQQVGRLTITPLQLDGEPGEPFLLLHEAIEHGLLEVVETESGNVNEVVAHNRSDRPILILEGESIQGAKQNSVITEDILVAAGTSVPVSVGCVEAGRWDHAPRAFTSSSMPVEPAIRALLGQFEFRRPRRSARSLGGGLAQARDHGRRIRDLELPRVHGNLSGTIRGGCSRTECGRSAGRDPGGGRRAAGRDRPRRASAQLGRARAPADFVVHAGKSTSATQKDDIEPRPRRSPKDWLRAIVEAPVWVGLTTFGIGQQFGIGHVELVGGGLFGAEGRPAHLAAFGYR